MILTLIIFFDYWLLWFARKSVTRPQNFKIHILATVLLILFNSIFLFLRLDLFRKAEKSFYKFSTRMLDPIARFITRYSLPIFILVLAYGVIARLNTISTYPIDVRSADMLPLIKSAITAFLSGDNPYQFYTVPGPMPLYYFPLLWLSYLPAYVLRLDLRIIGLITSAVILFIFWHESRRMKGSVETNPLEPLLVFSLGIFYFLSPYMIFFIATGHCFPYWLCLIFFLYFLQNDRPALAAIFLGLAVSARQPALVLVPFFLIYLFKNFRRKDCFLWTALVAISAAALILPFFLANPKAFLLDSLLNVNAELSYGWRPAILGSVGLTNVFYYFGITRFLIFVQAAVLVLFLLLALFKVRDKVSLFAFSGFAVFLYNLFLFHIPAHYFYIPALIIFSFAAMENGRRAEPVTPLPPLAVKKFFKLMAITVAPVFVLFLFFADLRGLFSHGQVVLRRGFQQTEKKRDGFTYNWVVGDLAMASFPASVTDIISVQTKPVSFMAVPYHYPNSPPQFMEIFVNDQEFSTIRMKKGWKRYYLSIPAQLFYVGCNKIEFRFAYATAPSKVDDSKDERQLAAAFHFLK